MKKIICLFILSICILNTSLYSQQLVSFTDDYVLYGYKDSTEKVVISPKFHDAYDFSDGLGAVKLDEKWGYVNKAGKLVIPYTFNSAGSFYEGVAFVNTNGVYSEESNNFLGGWVLIDKSNKQILKTEYDHASPFDKHGFSAVKLNGKEGFIDKTGTFKIPCIYDAVMPFSEGFAWVNKGGVNNPDKGWLGGWGFIDLTGKEIIPFKYTRAGDFSEGLSPVEWNDKWGYVNTSGLEVIPCIYESASIFENGKAEVRLNSNSNWFYIDKTGKEVK